MPRPCLCALLLSLAVPALSAAGMFGIASVSALLGLAGHTAPIALVVVPFLPPLAAGWLWRALSRTRMNSWTALSIVGFTGSMVNTVTVMGSIFLLFTQQYAQAKEVALEAVSGLILTTVLANGIPEAIVSTVLVAVIGKNLLRFAKPRLQAV